MSGKPEMVLVNELADKAARRIISTQKRTSPALDKQMRDSQGSGNRASRHSN